jgi:hypothetical protein
MTCRWVLVMMVEFWTRNREIGDEDKNDTEDMTGCGKSEVPLARLGLADVIPVLLPTESGLLC